MAGWPLPNELTSLVFEYLEGIDSLAASAAATLQWQPIVERRTFSKLKLSRARVDDFDGIMLGARRTYVTQITVQALEGAKGHSADLTSPIQKLLQSIHGWDDDDVNNRGIKLVINGLNTSDIHQSRRETPGWWARDQPKFDLPLVPAIRRLEISRLPGYRAWVPAYCSHIVAQLPKLESYVLNKVECGHQDWNEFTDHFESWPPTVQNVKLSMVNVGAKHNSDPSRLDVLSMNMHRLSRQLKDLEFSACTWTDVFMPEVHVDEETGSLVKSPPAEWPLLETFNMKYTDVTPQGNSLYASDLPADNLYDRTALNDDLLNDLYLAAGRAALRMPRLKYMQLGPMGWNSWTHVFVYEVRDRRATVRWNAGMHFTPDPEVVELWRSVARLHGVDLKVVVECA